MRQPGVARTPLINFRERWAARELPDCFEPRMDPVLRVRVCAFDTIRIMKCARKHSNLSRRWVFGEFEMVCVGTQPVWVITS
jgi:hypothetical protein